MYLAESPQRPFTLPSIVGFLSFWWLNIIPLYIDTPKLFYTFIHQWTLRLLSYPCYYKQCCYYYGSLDIFSSVQFSHSVMFNALRPHGLQKGRPPCLYKLLEFNLTHPIESVMPSNHLILCRPLLLLPLIFPSIRVFSNESFLHIRWSKYWSFSFSISPSNEYSGLISLGWTGCISLQSKELSRVFSNSTDQKHQFLGSQLSL